MENKKQNLVVSECFYSIQGEGRTTGVPAVFLRLAGCNLLCKSEHWVCDSIEVWQKGYKTPFDKVFTSQMIEAFKNGAHLVLTGGEPMLHQTKVLEFLDWFYSFYRFLPYLEIETNGTIMPNEKMLTYLDQINCSPKLENSGEPIQKRFKKKVLQTISNHKNHFFKFVVDTENDIKEIFDLIQMIEKTISKKNIYLMPAGETQEKLKKTRLLVAEACKDNFLNYTERAHIVIWNEKTGV